MKKKEIDINSIVEEYKMSMGGSFFSRADHNEDQQKLIDDAIENHLFDAGKLLITYDQLSADKKRELFYKTILSLINKK